MKALCFFLAGASLASFVSHTIFTLGQREHERLYDKSYTVQGYVEEVLYDNGHTAGYIVRIERAGDKEDFTCLLKGQGGLTDGSKFSCIASFSKITSENFFDTERYYLSLGIMSQCSAEDIRYKGSRDFSIFQHAREINKKLSQVYGRLLSEKASGIANALVLGNKSGLTKTVVRDFSRLGLSHILSISGMHLAIICAFVARLSKPFGTKGQRLAMVLTVLFYMFITGLSPTVTRSGLMLMIFIFSTSFKHRGDPFTNLGLSVFIIAIIDPYSCTDIGLQLSFCAVFGILLYITNKKPSPEKIFKKSRVPYFIRAFASSFLESVLLTVVIILFLIPLEWRYFGQIFLISPLTSPLFSIVFTALLWLLPLLMLLSPAHTVAALMAAPLSAVIEWICDVSNKISLIENVTVSIKYPFAFFFVFPIFVAVCIFCIARGKRRIVCVTALVLTICVFTAYCALTNIPGYNRVSVSMINSQKSDGLFVKSDGKVMLIDIGNGYKGIYNESGCYMTLNNATEYEAVMLTHIHLSHAKTLDAFFGENIVRSLILPNEEGKDLQPIKDLCKKHGVRAVIYDYNDRISFEDCVIRAECFSGSESKPVISIRLEAFGKTCAYVGGELEGMNFEGLDYLWLGNHGSGYKNKIPVSVDEECKIFGDEALIDVLPPFAKIKSLQTVVLE